jgi:two-component system NarL family sensor kinase
MRTKRHNKQKNYKKKQRENFCWENAKTVLRFWSARHRLCLNLSRFGMTENSRVFSTDHAESDAMRSLLRRVLLRGEEQKAALARDIHDGLSQKLVELSLSASLLDNGLAVEKQSRPAVGEMSRRLLRLVQNAIDCAIKLKGELNPCVDQYFGLAAAMEGLAMEFQRKTKILTRFIAIDADVKLSPSSSAQLHFVVRELLNNIDQHARATEVEIKVWQEKNRRTASVQVSDNGIGMSEKTWTAPESLGLMEIRERIRAVHGEILFEGKPHRGASFRISIPASITEKTSCDA